MWGIRFNNERSWFEAHKQVYLTHFYRPMCDLADEVYEFLRQERPDAGLIRKVTRIYRDARRLHGRGTDSEEKIQQRLETARREAKEIVNYDYIVVNDTVDRAVGEILAILIAEGCRKERRLHLVEGV